MTKLFKVAAVSSAPNSFGLWGHVLIARDGTSYEVARSRGEWMGTTWARGTEIEVPLSETGVPCWASIACEIPRELPKAPAKVVKEVWRKINALGIPIKPDVFVCRHCQQETFINAEGDPSLSVGDKVECPNCGRASVLK